jgi:hypothetical protein
MKHKTKALLLGIAIPAGIPLILIIMFSIAALFPQFRYALLVGCAVGGIYYTLLSVIYFVHVVKNKELTMSDKTRWIVIFLIFSIFAFPVYWQYHVRKH